MNKPGGFTLDTFWNPVLKFPGSNDLKVHEEQVGGGESIDSEPDVDYGVKNFSIFAGHIVSSGKK